VRIDIDFFTIQPELAYVVRKGKATGASGTSIEFETGTFDIPILLGAKFVDSDDFKMRVLLGPVLSFNTSKKSTSAEIFSSAPDYVTAWQAGLAIDIWKFILDVRYEGTFEAQLTDAVGNNAKLNAIQVGLSYKIF